MAQIEESNQHKNAKQISHTYSVGDYSAKTEINFKDYIGHVMDHIQLKKSTQMVHLRYVNQRKSLFVKPYNT
jgi:hypothetical protein